MRLFLPMVMSVAVLAAAAQAQVTTPAPASPQGANSPAAASSTTAAPPAAAHHRRGLRERFEAANTTHDGHLTPEQAQASWPWAAKHFAEIDKANRGYVTLDDIHTYRREHRHHRAAASAAAAPAPGAPGTLAPAAAKPSTGQ
jgi:hypothetical protein